MFWQKYVSCALGIISRDGRNISFREVSRKARTTYNFSPTLALFMTRGLSQFLDRSYLSGRFDLSDADAHNCIEHDASFTRMLSIKPLRILALLTNPASPFT
jgi:Peroxidase, family 2